MKSRFMTYYIWDRGDNSVHPVDLETYAAHQRALYASAGLHEGVEQAMRVALDTVDDLVVSTIFLSINLQHGDGPPVLWETMVFCGDRTVDDFEERYTSYADAVAGHARMVECVRALRSHEANDAI